MNILNFKGYSIPSNTLIIIDMPMHIKKTLCVRKGGYMRMHIQTLRSLILSLHPYGKGNGNGKSLPVYVIIHGTMELYGNAWELGTLEKM